MMTNKYGRRPDIKSKEIVDLYTSGYSANQIAKKFNCSTAGILDRLVKSDVKKRSHKEVMINAVKNGRLNNPVGEKHPHWKGGRIQSGGGYVGIWNKNHNRSSKDGYVLEHILVWEKFHNMRLPDGYIIHHLNGIRDDNRRENLLATTRKDHHRLFLLYQARITQLEQEVRYLRSLCGLDI